MKVIEGNIASPKGFYADGQHVGLKKVKKDLGWIYSEVPAQVAGVFTTNKIKAAPILVTEKLIKKGELQGLIVNSGNANACTGKQGLKDAELMQEKAAEALGVNPELVAVASTGVIGELLPMDKIISGIEQLHKTTGNPIGLHESILTTDTTMKDCLVSHDFNGKEVLMAGVSKGSGMIHPNMATMLGFITTDAKIASNTLQKLLKEVIDVTFNQITVDGDTSTNDMVLVLANGQSESAEIVEGSSEYQDFKEMLQLVCQTLAKKIAQDGEGATKLIEVNVETAINTSDARMMAKEVVGSSLVKTAIFGEDPNWGRIICAMGYSGVDLDEEILTIAIGENIVFSDGKPQAFDEESMKTALSKDTVVIDISLNQGEEKGTAWGCDLSYDYVKINALYRT